ncbi:hypothetical protein, partial [Klebsiella pneumoniae]|uniref:hypothetical protein n=1 Tax=Klebsiella pneumoniae TaxID=573 RepID=UPI0026596549
RVTLKNAKYIKNNKLVFFPYLIFENLKSTPRAKVTSRLSAGIFGGQGSLQRPRSGSTLTLKNAYQN